MKNSIEKWVNDNTLLKVTSLLSNGRKWVKLGEPYNNLFYNEPFTPEEREKISLGLITIYESWKLKLDELNQPYYLKIWLFEDNFKRSQVVCSIGNFLDFYNDAFDLIPNNRSFPYESFGSAADKMLNFEWQPAICEEGNVWIGSHK